MIWLRRLRARFLLAVATFWLLRGGSHDRASAAALRRAGAWMAAAREAAERLSRIERPAPDADLLFGSRAIAAHLGIPKGTARHLIRSGAIPWFELGGVACARRSTLTTHFAVLEANLAHRRVTLT